MKHLQPEEIARKIVQFDREMCTEVFLSELKPLLPTPEQVILQRRTNWLFLLTLVTTGWETECLPKCRC